MPKAYIQCIFHSLLDFLKYQAIAQTQKIMHPH